MCQFLSGFYDQEKCEFIIIPGVDSHSQIAKIKGIDEDSERYWRFELVPPQAKKQLPKNLVGWRFSWDEPAKTQKPIIAYRPMLREHFRREPYVFIPELLGGLYLRFVREPGFMERFCAALRKGVDANVVLPRFLLAQQERNLGQNAGAVAEAIKGVVGVLKNWIATGMINRSAARSAWSAADSAARSAWSAARSAESAADSAAWAAWSAADSAARSADSAASAADSAARSAETMWQAETLLKIMEKEAEK